MLPRFNFSRFSLACFSTVCFLLCAPWLSAAQSLERAFIFGSRDLTCMSLTEPGTRYTVVLQGSPDQLAYRADRGWGYEVLYSAGSSPYGDRNGYGIFGPFDDSANNRTQFPDDCPEEIFDSFIGAKNFRTQCNQSVTGDRTSPCNPPEGIIFRVDVPNGRYRFVAAVGSADNRHAHRIVAEDGGSGPPENIGPNHVVLVNNFDQAEYGPGVFAWVGFGDFTAPNLQGPRFVHIDRDGNPTDGPPDSPVLEVTQGYIRIHQLQGNSNDGAAGSSDPNGGDMVLLELWKVGDLGPDTTPPEVVSITPPPAAVVRALREITIRFSEEVTGVDASDLLVAGSPALAVSGSGEGPYTFSFNDPGTGEVTVGWSPDHGITDLAETPNLFSGGSWKYTVDPTAPVADVLISEFMAANGTVLEDEDGDSPDWIELWNRSGEPVNLGGWSLTDRPEPTSPGDPPQRRWVFPNVTLGPNRYLVVFASGKDRKPTSGGNLHTNFKLNREGGYLALYDQDGVLVSEFAPYPEQRRDYSYGVDVSDRPTYFLKPTPGAPNSSATAQGLVAKPKFLPEHGVYDDPIDVTLYCSTPGATILYRIDPSGRLLNEANGTEYSGDPIHVEGRVGWAVVTIQAMAVKPGYIPSEVVASSYIFRPYVLLQPNDPEGGFPSEWVNPSTGKTIAADYEMDQRVLRDPTYKEEALEALKEVPTLLINMDVDDLFGSNGIYVNANRDCYPGQGASCRWERECIAEMIYPGGRKGFVIRCGIRMQGGSSRHSVWKSPKLSFRLIFRDDYGPAKLRFPLFPDSRVMTFNSLILDAKLNMVWTHPSSSQTDHAQYVRELYCDDVQNAMGSHAPHDIVVNLYINGVHWGWYNIHERPDHHFASSYFGGRPEDYDVLKHRPSTVVNPDPPNQNRATSAWNVMRNIITSTPVSNSQYEQVQKHLDVVDLCDYMIMNLYVGNTDWPHQNWYATHNTNGGLWRFHSWDAEHVLKIPEVNYDTMNEPTAGPKELFEFLMTNAEFRLLFADRVQKHFFNGGVLFVDPDSPQWDPNHPENNIPAAMYMRRATESEKLIVLESARWGDYRRPSDPYTKADWLRELNGLLKNYFPYRSANVLNHFRSHGFLPSVGAPVFSKHGGGISPGFKLTISRPSGTTGTIYYTLDGSDPRQYGTGTVSPTAKQYSAPITLNETTLVKARIRSGNQWSALTEALFRVPSPFDNLKITEVMYNPPPQDELDGDSFEFIELKNTGPDRIDLTEAAFIEGIRFRFPEGMIVDPGAFVVLVSNPDAFHLRYPTVRVDGVYEGRLDNDRDTVTLVDPEGRVLISFKYADAAWWPREADGEGYSLVPVDPLTDESLDNPFAWRASSTLLGTPGADDGATVPFAPRFVVQPSDLTVKEGLCATFVVQAVGFPEPTYQWERNGAPIPGATGSTYTTPPLSLSDSGTRFACVVTNTVGSARSHEALLTVVPNTSPFIRGDANGDGGLDLSDSVAILRHLFGGAQLGCMDSADANDSGDLNLADAVYLLGYLFGGGPPPPDPFPGCGHDTTTDELRCVTYEACK